MFSIEYIFHSVIDEGVASSFQISILHVFISIYFVNGKASGLADPSCVSTSLPRFQEGRLGLWKWNQSKGHHSVFYPNQLFLLTIGISSIIFWYCHFKYVDYKVSVQRKINSGLKIMSSYFNWQSQWRGSHERKLNEHNPSSPVAFSKPSVPQSGPCIFYITLKPSLFAL